MSLLYLIELIFNVRDDKKNYGGRPVPAYEDLTRTFINSEGVRGEFIVEVTTDTGHVFDIVVNARQFNK